jgi:hypothetical protein
MEQSGEADPTWLLHCSFPLSAQCEPQRSEGGIPSLYYKALETVGRAALLSQRGAVWGVRVPRPAAQVGHSLRPGCSIAPFHSVRTPKERGRGASPVFITKP